MWYGHDEKGREAIGQTSVELYSDRRKQDEEYEEGDEEEAEKKKKKKTCSDIDQWNKNDHERQRQSYRGRNKRIEKGREAMGKTKVELYSNRRNQDEEYEEGEEEEEEAAAGEEREEEAEEEEDL